MKIKITKTKTIEEKEEHLFDEGTYYFCLAEDDEEIEWVKVTIEQYKDSDFLFDITYEIVYDIFEDQFGVSYKKIEVEPTIPWKLQKFFLNSPYEKYQRIGKITKAKFKSEKERVLKKLAEI